MGTIDEIYMQTAIEEAKIAAANGEVPIGAVLVWKNEGILSTAHNEREQNYPKHDAINLSRTALAHAECMVIADACRKLGGWRLPYATLYVTVEPCPMCAGAIWNARIPRVVYGVKDARAGAMGSVLQLFRYPLNYKPEVICGVLEDDCRKLMTEFFAELRNRRKSV